MRKPITTRRRFLQASAALGAFGFGRAAFPWFVPNPTGKAKRCVLLWMNGGPSQFETFDPKPGTTNGGPTQAINTAVPGIQIAENLPLLARRMDKLSVLRNVTSPEGEHDRAQYYLHTGFRLVPAFPRPALGSVVSHEYPEMDFPKYVLLGNRSFGPAYCGPDHASFAVENAETAKELLGQIRRRKDDLEFLRTLNADFGTKNNVTAIARRRSMMARVENLVTTPFHEALDTTKEKQATRDRYGDQEFGQRCLLARRLLQRDVPFVEVQLDGWDTHVNNFEQVATLAAGVDSGCSALIDDLISDGLWNDTLLVWMGDFGRTPTINGQSGRDHFPSVTPVVLGGGCIQSGQVIGATNRTGTAIDGDTHSVADVSATILQLLGTPPDAEFTTTFGSPTAATDNGAIIGAIVG